MPLKYPTGAREKSKLRRVGRGRASREPWGGITSLAKLLTRVFGQEVSQSFGELDPKLPGLGCWVGVVLLPYLVLTG